MFLMRFTDLAYVNYTNGKLHRGNDFGRRLSGVGL